MLWEEKQSRGERAPGYYCQGGSRKNLVAKEKNVRTKKTVYFTEKYPSFGKSGLGGEKKSQPALTVPERLGFPSKKKGRASPRKYSGLAPKERVSRRARAQSIQGKKSRINGGKMTRDGSFKSRKGRKETTSVEGAGGGRMFTPQGGSLRGKEKEEPIREKKVST